MSGDPLTTEETLAAAVAAQESANQGENVDLGARIAAAEAAGDWATAGTLRTERLLRQMNPALADQLYEPPAPPAEVGTYDEIDQRLAKGEITVDEAGAEKTALLIAKTREQEAAAIAEVRLFLDVDAERDARIETLEETRRLYPDEFARLSIRELEAFDKDVESREIERIAARQLADTDRLYGRRRSEIASHDRIAQITGSVNAAKDIHASTSPIRPLAPAARERIVAEQRKADIAEHSGAAL